MSGYLARLASIAARPAPRVHPMLDSIYGAPSEQAGAPGMPLENSQLVPERGRSDRSAVTPEQARIVTQPPQAQAPAERQEHRSEAAREFDRDEPLIAPPETHEVVSYRGPSGSEHMRQASVEGPLEENSAPKSGPPMHPWQVPALTAPPPRISLDSVISRLFPEGSTDGQGLEEPAELPRETQSRTVATAQGTQLVAPPPTRRQDSPAQPRSATTSTDEIQIHIGRIEVVAVPQAAPRPAPATRKGLSLDEYLARRNGRAG